jgi:hypothetical protein
MQSVLITGGGRDVTSGAYKLWIDKNIDKNYGFRIAI